MRPVLGFAAIAAVAMGIYMPGQAAAPDMKPLSTIYDFYLGGVKAGELTVDAQVEGETYRAQSNLRTAGVVGMVYKASFEAETEGRLEGPRLIPDRFAAASRMKKKEQFVEMTYAGDAPAGVTAKPAFQPRPWEVDPIEQGGTLDPISAALIGLAPVPVGEICNKTVEIFDGRRRYAIDLGAPSPDGERIKCPAKYRRIAGFKPKMMKKQAEFPFDVWFVERPDGLAHFIRAAGESMFGVAVILLRE